MQNGWSYIRDSNDFNSKIKNLENIRSNSILVTADIVGLYLSIPHESGLKAIKEVLENRARKSVPTSDKHKMLEFVLNNNYFEFNSNVKQQLSGTAIGTKCAPPYACIFMDKVETDFLESQKLKPMVWFRYINDIFFIWTHGEQELQRFLQELNKTHPNLTFTSKVQKFKSRVKKRFHFWIYLLVYVMRTFIQISILKLLIAINIWNTRHLIQSTLRNPPFIVRIYV